MHAYVLLKNKAIGKIYSVFGKEKNNAYEIPLWAHEGPATLPFKSVIGN